MRPIRDYIEKTRSATSHLFSGLRAYVEPLESHKPPILVGFGNLEERLREWQEEHRVEIEESLAIQRRYLEEYFAMTTIGGAILQIAYHGFVLCSNNNKVSSEFGEVISAGSRPAKFCVGRSIRRVPLGLVVYAGRNQHMHMEDAELNNPSSSILQELRSNPSERDQSAWVLGERFVHEAEESLAKTFIDILQWHSLDAYERDLIAAIDHA